MQPLDLFVLKRRHRGCIYLCNYSNMNLLSGSNMKGVSIYEYFLLNPTKANTLHSLTESLSRLASKKDGASKRLLTNLARTLPLFPGKFDAI